MRPEDQGPVVEPPADDGSTQLVGGGLQRGYVVDGEKGMWVLRKPICARFSSFDEAVAVEVIAGLKWKERAYPHDDRAWNLVADVEIVMGEPAALRSKDPVIGMLGGVFRHGNAKRWRPALEDEIAP